ncbi:MAG: glycosyltransferase family 2 protein [Streptosporangiaceae bacterium]
MKVGDDVYCDVTVVVCAYSELRWEQIKAAIGSVQAQQPAARQVLLVVDHNPKLESRARAEFDGLTVLRNEGPQGLSGARNTGLNAAKFGITAFLDDDAQARPGWLAALMEPYRRPEVVATGGAVYPRWHDARPRWLPACFDWVVGCSYAGLPEATAPVRNPIGASMSMRTSEALAAGGFNSVVGRVGTRPRGCEETELAIRLTAARPGSQVIYVPDSAVDHHVPRQRARVRYFLSRCWQEGRSKADVVMLAGSRAGLERERRQVAVVIPAAILGDIRSALGGNPAGLARAAAAVAGLAVTSAGYVTGRTRRLVLRSAELRRSASSQC